MAPFKRLKSIIGRKDGRRDVLCPTLPLVCRGLQPTGLICHVEVFQVAMATEENPAQVADFAVLPSSNPACTLYTIHNKPHDLSQMTTDRPTSNSKRSSGRGILEKPAHHSSL